MSVGTFDTISEEYIISTAKMELALYNSTLDDALLKSFLYQAIKDVRSAITFIEDWCCVGIDEYGRGKLPCHFVKFKTPGSVYVTNPDSADSPGGYAYRGAGAFPQDHPNSNYIQCPVALYQVIGGYLQFNENAGIEEVMVSYIKVRTDSDDNILFPSAYERCLVAFVKWKYAQFNFREFPANLRLEFREEWINGRRYLRGVYNEPDAGEKELMSIWMNTLVT